MNRSNDTGETSARRAPLWAVFLGFFAVNALLLAAFFLTLSPERSDPARIHVPSGATVSRIAGMLQEERVIRSPLAFRVLTRLRGLSGELRAGDYNIPPGSNLWDTISLLTTGTGRMVRFTVPEGLTDKQTAGRVANALANVDSAGFMALARGDSLAAELGLDAPRLIGYLFPDTYFVPPDISSAEVIRLMVERFQAIYSELAARGDSPTGLDRHHSVILASIVEKEAVLDRERPVISSVFLNRLERRRPLESCATVLFVLGKHKSRLLYRDLEVESPYNTYLNRGLPPGPICNPGRASLEAALYPEETSYLYFVARGDGSHAFSRSLTEHNRAKRRFLRSGPGG